MKNMFTRGLVLSLLVIGFAFNSHAQKKKKADKATAAWRYEVECMGTGVQGTYLVKVWSYSKKPTIAIEWSKKNAVHGIIFRGFGAGKQGCPAQKPLARDASVIDTEAAFFDAFFETKGGDFLKFVSKTGEGGVGAGDVMKVNKKEYKIGVVVSVRKDELRKHLENKGIIKGMASGF